MATPSHRNTDGFPKLMKSVANRGDADRVHLVIDAGVNEWVEAAFAAAARAQT
jgi:hypothetical protein